MALHSLYGAGKDATQIPELRIMAKKIANVLVTLGELPHIRYYDPEGSKMNIPSRLAQMVHDEMAEITKMDPEFPPRNNFKRVNYIN